jgi:hypothetical protein
LIKSASRFTFAALGNAGCDVEKFRFRDSSYRKAAGEYVGMTVWVSEAAYLPAFKEIPKLIPKKV